jgi:hypothetical protein
MDLYVAGHKAGRPRRGKRALLTLLGIVVVVITAFAVRHLLSSDTSLGETPPAATSKVSLPIQHKRHISERFFSLDLPTDWRSTASPNQPYAIYSWHNTAGNKGVRRLDVYLDGAPRLAVNRVLPVQANGTRLVLLGQVSDNCMTFTEGAKRTAAASMPAKWRGVNFLCDTANPLRDVVGTSSPNGIDTVKVSSPGTGTHDFFFVYTDNSATPDYDVFTGIVTSFQAK